MNMALYYIYALFSHPSHINKMEFQLTTKNIEKIIERSFMYTNKTSFQNHKLTEKKKTQLHKSCKTSSSKRFTPEEKDAWFWIYYVLKYDILQYTSQKQHFMKKQKEINENIQLLSNDETIKSRWKRYGLKKSDVYSSILNDNELSIDAFIGLAILYNWNVRLIQGPCYLDIHENSNEDTFHIIEIIETNKAKRPYIILEPEGELKKDNYIAVKSLSKPLRAISNYKLADLQHIAGILKLDIFKKKKAELYSVIQSKLN